MSVPDRTLPRAPLPAGGSRSEPKSPAVHCQVRGYANAFALTDAR
ncbi:hypothetical protein ACTMTJ_40395 [Phytohabitans sp. LJ34]